MVEASANRARELKIPLGQALIEDGVVDANQLAQALAERNGLDHVDLNVFEADMGAANLIEASKARRYRAILIAFSGERALLVATADPANVLALDDIAMATGYEVRRAVASADDIAALQMDALPTRRIGPQDRRGGARAGSGDRAARVRGRGAGSSSSYIRSSPTRCSAARPTSTSSRARATCACASGSTAWCPTSVTVPRRLVAGLVSRVKIMAELDIAERRVPQDGRVGLTVEGRRIDLRVATLPVVRGESVVMRILDQGEGVTELDALGMEPHDRERFERALLERTGRCS